MDTNMKKIMWSVPRLHGEDQFWAELSDLGMTVIGTQVIAQNQKGGSMTLCSYVPHGDEDDKSVYPV